jgi:hypothetical protein
MSFSAELDAHLRAEALLLGDERDHHGRSRRHVPLGEAGERCSLADVDVGRNTDIDLGTR